MASRAPVTATHVFLSRVYDSATKQRSGWLDMRQVKLQLLMEIGVCWRPMRLYDWFCTRAIRDRRISHIVRRNIYEIKFVHLPGSGAFPDDFKILDESALV